jgi:hypothetical protein
LNVRIGTSVVALQDGSIAKFTNFAIGYGENRYEICADGVLLNISSSVLEFSALRRANEKFSIRSIASQSNVVPVRHEAQPLIVGRFEAKWIMTIAPATPLLATSLLGQLAGTVATGAYVGWFRRFLRGNVEVQVPSVSLAFRLGNDSWLAACISVPYSHATDSMTLRVTRGKLDTGSSSAFFLR